MLLRGRIDEDACKSASPNGPVNGVQWTQFGNHWLLTKLWLIQSNLPNSQWDRNQWGNQLDDQLSKRPSPIRVLNTIVLIAIKLIGHAVMVICCIETHLCQIEFVTFSKRPVITLRAYHWTNGTSKLPVDWVEGYHLNRNKPKVTRRLSGSIWGSYRLVESL